MTYRQFWQALTTVYPEGEARWIARMVMETRYHLNHADLLMGREESLDEAELFDLRERLLTGEPVQYVLGEAEFCGRWFHVEPGVLIPRPETEELCRWVLEEIVQRRVERGERREFRGELREESGERREDTNEVGGRFRILDIGTGSGCIACTLAAELPDAEVSAWDISEEALEIAMRNAKRTHVHVSFEQVDILTSHLSPLNSQFSILVSNPPYVCQQEKAQMEHHVLDYEPSLALFVPDDDPLLFYRAIGRFALGALQPGGRLFFELNVRFARDTAAMLEEMGFSRIVIRKDQFDKERFIRACRT